ncbi:MAG: S8 family serine peptidase [Bacteroidetes bacterium]|nr:S8 family serine peptidase [Bacteroidota bacterium]
MKHLTPKAFILFLALLMAIPAFTQQSMSSESTKKMAREQEKEWKQMAKRAKQYARANNLEIRQEHANGTIVELIDVVDGMPVYYKTLNLGAAITTRANQLWQGGGVGVIVEGEGYDKVGIWDGGAVRRTHQEFNNTGVPRVTDGDGTAAQSGHATHVAGTIVAGGVNANAKGMAHKAILKGYNWTSVESEMTVAAGAGMEISNHSWGQIRGWDQNQTTGNWNWYGNASVSPLEDYLFGFYNSQARSWDIIAYNNPYFLIVKAAGNDRGEGPNYAGTENWAEKDGGLDGYDCIEGSGVSKNVLSIGAVSEVLNYVGPQSVSMSNFSSWGPADDGRIKPDLVGKGVGVNSPYNTSNTSYQSLQGTSMSSPNVTGSLVLLQQLYQNTHNGTRMRASTLKGLAIHTADEAGAHPGPDYRFGWGLMNTARAAEVIIEDAEAQSVISEITLENNATYTREVTVSGNAPFRVTISWTDRQGNVLAASLNNRTPSLIHDLDLRIVDENQNVYYPYKLDPDNPAAAATTDSKNLVDNVEMVYIPEPTPGTYTIIVDHVGSLVPNQVFSIIVSGIDDYQGLPECSEGMIDPVDGYDQALLNHKVTWSPAAFATGYEVYFGTDGEGITPPTNILNGAAQIDNFFRLSLDPVTTYYLMVKPKNSFGVNECTEIYSFTTMDVISTFPYLMNVEAVTPPAMPDYWSAVNYTAMSWITTGSLGQNSQKSFACYIASGAAQQFNNWLISPPFQVEASKEYNITFGYRGFLPTFPESMRLVWGTSPDTSSLTNVLFENPSFNLQSWLVGNALLVPGIDGFVFLSWHANTANGRGQFVDNVLVEDWGPVGVIDSPERKVRVYHNDGILTVESEIDLGQIELKVINASGQTLLSEKLNGLKRFERAMNFTTGVYIISIKGAGIEKNTKLLIN